MPLYQIHGYKCLSNYKERGLAAAIINFHVQQFHVEAATVHVNFIYRCAESLDKWFHGPIIVSQPTAQGPGRTSTLWDGRQGKDEYNVVIKVGANSVMNWDVFCEELQKLWDTTINLGKGGHELKSIMIEQSLVAHWQSGKSVSLGLDAAPPYESNPAVG